MEPRELMLHPNIRSFEQEVLAAFHFLRAYDFHHNQTLVYLPDIEVRFRNSTTEIIVLFVVGSPPDVVLGRLGLVAGEVLPVEQYSMHYLLIERAPNERMTEVYELGDPGLPGALQHLADLLVKYGSDILKGDFTVFARLKVLLDLRAEGHLPEFP